MKCVDAIREIGGNKKEIVDALRKIESEEKIFRESKENGERGKNDLQENGKLEKVK